MLQHRLHAFKGCQNDISLLGLDRMLDLLWDQFYQPSMQADAKEHVQNCEWYFKVQSQTNESGVTTHISNVSIRVSSHGLSNYRVR